MVAIKDGSIIIFATFFISHQNHLFIALIEIIVYSKYFVVYETIRASGHWYCRFYYTYCISTMMFSKNVKTTLLRGPKKLSKSFMFEVRNFQTINVKNKQRPCAAARDGVVVVVVEIIWHYWHLFSYLQLTLLFEILAKARGKRFFFYVGCDVLGGERTTRRLHYSGASG